MMHEIIQDGLEDYLSGAVRRDFQAHLDQCDECRREVSEISGVSVLFAAFKEVEAPQPEPGFYYRLSQNLEASKSASPWSIFSINGAFGRRVAFASLVTLGILGGFLISREADFGSDAAIAPDAIIASHDGTSQRDPGTNRDRMMYTLATYQR
ncbi:MAG: putative transrane anti-sigma factor [Bryobacterales bacterium]|nr:putative transrane anti-sigma factor [Bryobacterales bacterium]